MMSTLQSVARLATVRVVVLDVLDELRRLALPFLDRHIDPGEQRQEVAVDRDVP
jgi:hypothetical protein